MVQMLSLNRRETSSAAAERTQETLRLGQTDGMVLHKVNCSRYLNIGGTERSLQCQ